MREQAVSIIELLKTYDRLEDLYLPLWQLGYPIPLHRVRVALGQPLEGAEGPHSLSLITTFSSMAAAQLRTRLTMQWE